MQFSSFLRRGSAAASMLSGNAVLARRRCLIDVRRWRLQPPRVSQVVVSSSSQQRQQRWFGNQNNDDSETSWLVVREVSSSQRERQKERQQLRRQRDRISRCYDLTNVTTNKTDDQALRWKDVRVKDAKPDARSSPDFTALRSKVFDSTIGHLLPSDFPHDVAPGYLNFVSFGFVASVAGSATMVLSTQTVLLAVGVVGSANASTAPILAGALNWVLKDGIGQIGGVLFASYMGKSRSIDADPKRWRVWAALALDGATLLELLSPTVPPFLLLPVASLAMVFKNVGFLTASASRAALHQCLARANNLGDVTAKSVSQSIAASVLGTSVGIGITTGITADPNDFLMIFGVLGVLRQGANYTSLKYVPLQHFNRHRLHLVITRYFLGRPVSPTDIASEESFWPGVVASGRDGWLTIGAPLHVAFVDPQKLKETIERQQSQRYLISQRDDVTHVLFFERADGEDMVRAVFQAYKIKYGQEQHDTDEFITHIQSLGWKLEADGTILERRKSRRIRLETPHDKE